LSSTEVTMAEIGPRRKRMVQEPLREPSRDPVHKKPARKHKPKRKVRAPA
jgi:hypothetical protein